MRPGLSGFERRWHSGAGSQFDFAAVSAIARHTAFHVAPLLYRDTLALADFCRGNLLLASENVGTRGQKIPESVG